MTDLVTLFSSQEARDAAPSVQVGDDQWALHRSGVFGPVTYRLGRGVGVAGLGTRPECEFVWWGTPAPLLQENWRLKQTVNELTRIIDQIHADTAGVRTQALKGGDA